MSSIELIFVVFQLSMSFLLLRSIPNNQATDLEDFLLVISLTLLSVVIKVSYYTI
jgi:hypothetical protein